MKTILKTSLFLFVVFMSFGSLKAETIFDADRNQLSQTLVDDHGVAHEWISEEAVLSQESTSPELQYHPVPVGHICYPWVYQWGSWYHHHVFWNGWGWVHGYFRSVYAWHQFFNRYVWFCTFNGCGAIHF